MALQMLLTAFGLNYQTAPVATREKIALATAQLPRALTALSSYHGVQEAAILSTCNRTEFYCSTIYPNAALKWLLDYFHLEHNELIPYLYQLHAVDAARHIFRVAAGLESMVLGEAQILGQFKHAVRIAHDHGTLGSLLNRLFQCAFQAAKSVRTKTQIGNSSISLATACLRLAERIFPSIAQCRVLFIGAGEMISLCAPYFAAQRPQCLDIANRTYARGAALAQKVGARSILLSELPNLLADYDIVITSTASTLPILGKGMIESAVRKRRRKPIFMVDLAVPRDIELEVAELNDVYLYTIDDLSCIVNANKEARALCVLEAENILDVELQAFTNWLQKRAALPTIRDLKTYAEKIRLHELHYAQKQLAKGESMDNVLSSLSHRLMNKYLHAPLVALNTPSVSQQTQSIKFIRKIYDLPNID